MVRRVAALLVLRVEMIRIARQARAEAGWSDAGDARKTTRGANLIGLMLGGSARKSVRRRSSAERART
jgi:hypothetical protein